MVYHFVEQLQFPHLLASNWISIQGNECVRRNHTITAIKQIEFLCELHRP